MANIKGMDSLIKKLNKIDKETKSEIMKKAVESGARAVQAQAKLNCPVNNGGLRRSVKLRTEIKENGEVQCAVYSNKKYAAYTEFGTGLTGERNKPDLPPEVSEEIVYSQKDEWFIPGKALKEAEAEKYHFRAYKGKGGKVKYYRVRGQKPQPFLYPAAMSEKEKVNERAAKVIKRELKKVVKG